MELFKGGELDRKLAAAYVRELEARLREHDKEWLARMLAVEIVDREIERQVRKSADEEILSAQVTAVREDQRLTWLIGLNSRRAQAARRKNKPTGTPYDLGRNDRIRTFVARLKAAGEPDVIARAHDEFNLSVRQVRRIVNK